MGDRGKARRGWIARQQDRAVLKAAFAELDLPAARHRKLIRDIQSDADALTAADKTPRPDAMANHHLAAAHLILAADRALAREGIDAERRRGALAHGMATPGRSAMHIATRMLLWGRADKLKALADYSETRIPPRYGASFEVETAERSADTFVQSITRCAYHDVFTRNGAPELTTIMCAFDKMWIDAIDPAKDGVRFERPTTLAEGGKSCRFEFRRVRRPSDQGQS